MNIRIFENAEMAAVYAAAIVEYVVMTHPKPVLGLATGSTPIPLYESLVSFYRQGLHLAHVTTVNLDEYVGLGAQHPQSYQMFMDNHLFSHVDIPANRRFLPNGVAPDLAAECQRYDAIIRDNPIDLQILGIGVNGHIGFNEPDTMLKPNTHVIQLAPDTIAANSRFFKAHEEVPTSAITMGLQPILMAKQVLLIAFGHEKARAVINALKGDVQTNSPASILQFHSNVTFILDQEAAQLLE